MKNIIAGLATIIVIALMAYTASNGRAYQGGEHAKVIQDIGSLSTQIKTQTNPNEKDDRKKELDSINSLKEKAGNAGTFKVSNAYKSKCSSCHGANGSGYQNGRKMMGPKLFGQNEARIYKDLVDFKAGRKENIVMKGLLIPLDDKELKELSKEIGEFPARAKALEK